MKTTSCGDFRNSGFTLVELIMVIALSGIVAVMISTVMSRPLQSFADQSRRAELTDLAALALNRMARDIRLAVPNSVRSPGCVAGSQCRTLEMLEISEGGRYRANLHQAGGERFDPPRCPGEGMGDCLIPVLSPGMSADNAKWMVIYSTDTAQIWFPPVSSTEASVISPTSASISLTKCPESTDFDCLKLEGAYGFSFKYASPQHRFYLVRDVLGYRCENPGTDANGDGRGRILRRVFETLSGASSYTDAAPVVDSVSGCSFTYTPGTNTRNGLVTLHLSLAKGGETVSLLQQVHVDNAP